MKIWILNVKRIQIMFIAPEEIKYWESMPEKEAQERLAFFSRLSSKSFTSKDRYEYVVLKFRLIGKDDLYYDDHITQILRDIYYVSKNSEYHSIYLGNLLDWLVDWENSDENNFATKSEITQLQTITNPLFEFIATLLGLNNSALKTLKNNIANTIKEKLEDIIENSLDDNFDNSTAKVFHKIKMAVNYSKEFLNLSNTLLNIRGTDYIVDFMFLTHVLISHTCYFKVAPANKSIFDVVDEINNEHNELNEIMIILNDFVKKVNTDLINFINQPDGKIRYKTSVSGQKYHLILSNGRVNNFFPEGITGKICS